MNRPTGWFHIVLTLQEKNVIVYYNKVVQTPEYYYDEWTTYETNGPSDTVIGKHYVDDEPYHGTHSSVIMDELAMWNRVLSEAEVALIKDISFQWRMPSTLWLFNSLKPTSSNTYWKLHFF